MKIVRFGSDVACTPLAPTLAPSGAEAHNFAVYQRFCTGRTDRRSARTTQGAGERRELSLSVAPEGSLER